MLRPFFPCRSGPVSETKSGAHGRLAIVRSIFHHCFVSRSSFHESWCSPTGRGWVKITIGQRAAMLRGTTKVRHEHHDASSAILYHHHDPMWMWQWLKLHDFDVDGMGDIRSSDHELCIRGSVGNLKSLSETPNTAQVPSLLFHSAAPPASFQDLLGRRLLCDAGFEHFHANLQDHPNGIDVLNPW